jgi:hypothetical protein
MENNITALRALRVLSGRSLVQEAREVSVPTTNLCLAEMGEVVSDRTRRLIERRHKLPFERLQYKVTPQNLHIPREAVQQ